MAKAPDFKRLLAHPIKPIGGPQMLLVTLEDAAKFIGLMEPWGQATGSGQSRPLHIFGTFSARYSRWE
jgi:hypothetical protein